MLLLTFRSADNLYAVDARLVAEVVPRVTLRAIPHAPAYFSGLLNYRTGVVPVVDFNLLTGRGEGRDVLSTRIILNEFRNDAGATRQVGLIAEQVNDVIRGEASQRVLQGMSLPGAPYFGELYQLDVGLVQLVLPSRLLPPSLNEALYPDDAGTPL